MESLFETDYINTKPLRKYEPLIRFDSSGNPQPRKALQESTLLGSKVDTNLKQNSSSSKETVIEPKNTSKQTETSAKQENNSTATKQSDDLKRKVTEPPAPNIEPKKKQQKQTSIMSFFAKKA